MSCHGHSAHRIARVLVAAAIAFCMALSEAGAPPASASQTGAANRVLDQLRQLNRRQQGAVQQQQRLQRRNRLLREQRRMRNETLRLEGDERRSREMRDRRQLQRRQLQEDQQRGREQLLQEGNK
jgi:hypothetical protein